MAALQLAAVDALGATLATEIGQAYQAQGLDYALHKILHGALGCGIGTATASIQGGHERRGCESGALGAVAAEVIAESKLDALKATLAQDSDFQARLRENPQAAIAELRAKAEQLKPAALNASRLGAGLLALGAGLNPNIADQTASNAIQNNFWQYIAVTVIGWVFYEGAGNPLEGLRIIGAGDSVAGQFVGEQMGKVVRFSYEHYPEETLTTLEALETVSEVTGEAVEVLFTWVDDNTGQVISKEWKDLDQDTRDQLKGGATVFVMTVPYGTLVKAGHRLQTVGRQTISKIIAAQQALRKIDGVITKPTPDMLANPEHIDWARYVPESDALNLPNAVQSLDGVVARDVRYGPTNPGPLADDVAATFRGGSYTATTTSETTILYRVYGGSAGKLGPYWTRTKPSGPLQSQLDSALNPQWGNTANNIVSIKVPKGTQIFEGASAPQSTGIGQILGGGNQVYIPRVDPKWIQ